MHEIVAVSALDDPRALPTCVNIPVNNYERIQKLNLYVAWLEMWLQENCRHPWRLETIKAKNATGLPVLIQILFDDPDDGVLFKLSPEYDYSQPYRNAAICFQRYLH